MARTQTDSKKCRAQPPIHSDVHITYPDECPYAKQFSHAFFCVFRITNLGEFATLRELVAC